MSEEVELLHKQDIEKSIKDLVRKRQGLAQDLGRFRELGVVGDKASQLNTVPVKDNIRLLIAEVDRQIGALVAVNNADIAVYDWDKYYDDQVARGNL